MKLILPSFLGKCSKNFLKCTIRCQNKEIVLLSNGLILTSMDVTPRVSLFICVCHRAGLPPPRGLYPALVLSLPVWMEYLIQHHAFDTLPVSKLIHPSHIPRLNDRSLRSFLSDSVMGFTPENYPVSKNWGITEVSILQSPKPDRCRLQVIIISS